MRAIGASTVSKAPAFVPFSRGSLAYDVDAEPRAYAAAIRVEIAAGQQTFVMPPPGALDVG